jgi:hypothetical protein
MQMVGTLRFARPTKLTPSLRAKRLSVVIPRACGGSSTPRPINSITDASGILDHPLSRAMTAVSILAARCARSFAFRLPSQKSEGAGKTGCALHPRSRVRLCIKECCTRAYRFSGGHPAFPAQWLYGLYEFVLVTGFLATIILGSFRLRQLDASTGASDPNDFAVRFCCARQSQHQRPPLPALRLRRWPTPLWRDRMAGVERLICPTAPAKYFSREGWTGFRVSALICPSGYFVAAVARRLRLRGSEAAAVRAQYAFRHWLRREAASRRPLSFKCD